MKNNDTVIRSLHDIGLAGWFGSVAMGATAVNRAAGDLDDPHAVGRVTNGVWRRWWPVNLVLILMHLFGGMALTRSNAHRLRVQRGARSAAAVKTVLTVAALGASAYSGHLGRRISGAGDVALVDGTTPCADTPDAVAQAVKRQAVLQWVIPGLTGAMIVMGSVQGEQQRPSNVASGIIDRARSEMQSLPSPKKLLPIGTS